MNKKKLKNNLQVSIAAALIGASSSASALTLSTQNADVTLYGYAEMNASYDFDENIAASTRSGAFSLLGGDDKDVKGHFGMDAFQSRVGIHVVTDQDLKVRVETDFRGGGGGQIRLRQAYGEYKGWLAGQAWSNGMTFTGITPGLDFDGTPGMPGREARVAQVRYTTGNVSFSIEEPSTGLPSIVGTNKAKDSLPIVTARYENTAGGLRYAAGGLLQQVSFDDGVVDDSVLGYSGFIAATFEATDRLTLRGAFNYGDGAGTSLYRTGSNFFAEDAYLNGNDLETIEGTAAVLGASFVAGPGSIHLQYGYAASDWDKALADLGSAEIGIKHEKNEKASLGYLWSPIQNTRLGLEYSYFNRELVNGDKADANRLIFAAQYRF